MANKMAVTTPILLMLYTFAVNGVNSFLQDSKLPGSIKRCFDMAETCRPSANITDESIINMCEEIFNENKNGGLKIKAEHLVHFQEIVENLKNGAENHRRKRSTHCRFRRVRKEVRKLSRVQWERFTGAVNALKESGEYDSLAAIHRGFPRLATAHGGPNFLPWHRIYLLVFEELLREIEPCVTIPYWDTSLDYYMDDPTESILWTSDYFGNGDGVVTSGPFANWVTGQGQFLSRNIGAGGSLITKPNIKRVLRFYNNRTSKITDLFGRPGDSIELYHNGPHVWVDGQMSGLNTAAEDPVFFMHHAFIDCWWQFFRHKIFKYWGVNSTFDYPDVGGLHNGDNPMDPWENITNSEGMADSWYVYKCQNFPKCYKPWRNCRSPHLVCTDFESFPRVRCVSIGGAPSRMAIAAANVAMGSTTRIIQASLESTLQAPLQISGPTFQAPITDNRTLQIFPLQRTVFDLSQSETNRRRTDRDASTISFVSSIPTCSVVKDMARLHFSIAYLDPAKLKNVDKKGDFVYVPVQITFTQVANRKDEYTALIYGTNFNARYRAILRMINFENSSIAIVPMVNPRNNSFESIMTVFDPVGTKCAPKCLTEDSSALEYNICSGTITLNAESPHMYEQRYDTFLEKFTTFQISRNENVRRSVFLHFVCQPRMIT